MVAVQRIALRRGTGFAVRLLAPRLPVLATVAIVGAALVSIAAATLHQDTWVALVSGRELTQHGLPAHDHLTVLANGHRWVDQQWLGQLILYGVWSAGGLSALAALGICFALFGFGFAAEVGSRGGANPVVLTMLALLALAADPWALQVRTQEIALALYAVLLGLLLGDPRAERRRTLLAFPILALWANVHGSAALATVVVIVFGFSLLARRLYRRAAPYLILPLPCLFLTPYGPSLAGYYRLMLIHPPFAGLVNEWQPSRPSAITASFYLLALITLVTISRFGRRLEPFELVLIAITFAAGVAAIRNVVWFAILVVAVLPRRISPGKALAGKSAAVMASMAVVAIGAIVLLALARPDGYYTTRGLTVEAAKAATTALKKPGWVYADDAHADWVLLQVSAARGRVAYDSRLELVSRSDLKQLAAIQLQRSGYRGLLRPYRFVIEQPSRARSLTTSGWGQLVYQDETTSIVRRIGP